MYLLPVIKALFFGFCFVLHESSILKKAYISARLLGHSAVFYNDCICEIVSQ